MGAATGSDDPHTDRSDDTAETDPRDSDTGGPDTDTDVQDTDAVDTDTGDTDVDTDRPHTDDSDTGTIVPALPPRDAIAGPLTLASWGSAPFLSPADLLAVLLGPYSLGRELFVADWRPAPDGSRPNLDGLGPLLHATSCLACHPPEGRPRALAADGTVDLGILFRLARLDGANLVGDPVFGGQLQPAALSGVPSEATIRWSQQSPAPVGIGAASAALTFTAETHATYGALHADTRLGARLSPHLAGMGLLEAVSEADLLGAEDPDDLDGDGVSGRAARIGARLGRFGWKAIKPDLAAQTAGAFAGDLGVTSSLHTVDDCTAAQTACVAAPDGGHPEIPPADLEAVDVFIRLLGVPAARRDDSDPELHADHQLFFRSGCATCHTATLHTAPATPTPDLADVTFHPYTDLLLHDMGPELADPLGEGDATGAEWRTPPLWGLGLVAAQPHARFLHDGRAATLDDAIRWHGGEATTARDRYTALAEQDRERLLAYLRSL